MIKADTPNLWEIRNDLGEAKAKAILVTALIHLARLVNVERNLTDEQIGEIANDTINEYGYLKVEEIKYIFKKAVKKEKVFGRLDYNVVMGWIDEYDRQRTDLCIDISNQRDSEEESRVTATDDAISFEGYRKGLSERAKNGDEAAVELLADMGNQNASTMKLMTAEERHQKELDFKSYYYQYLNQKCKGKKTNI